MPKRDRESSTLTMTGAGAGFERTVAHVAADRAWLAFGLAAALGLVAGATLFPTQAHGRDGERDRPTPRM